MRRVDAIPLGSKYPPNQQRMITEYRLNPRGLSVFIYKEVERGKTWYLYHQH